MESMTQRTKKFITGSYGVIAILALVKLVIHIATSGQWDYFIDELYTMSCARHLDWGFVDIPPVAPAIGSIGMKLFGDSMSGARIIPAVCGALTVAFAGLIAKKMGGGRFAVFLTSLIVLFSPVWLVMNSFFAYDTFDQLFTLILLYILVSIVRDKNEKLWLAFGIVAGIALMTKISAGFFGLGLVVGMIFTKERSSFRSLWFWLGGAASIVIFLPYVIWQFVNGFPTLEYFAFYARFRTYHAGLVEYIGMQFFLILLPAIPLSMIGIWRALVGRTEKEFRILALVFLALNVFLFVINAKVYMVSAFYVPLFALGAIWLEHRFPRGTAMCAIRSAITALFVAVGIVLALACIPVLSPGQLEEYYAAIPVGKVVKTENSRVVEFPQYVADRFGWKELALNVARVYRSLSQDEQASCVIFTGNYGEAGAIDAYGKSLGLPPACSGHLGYFFWKPVIERPRVLISIGIAEVDLAPYFDSVECAAIHSAQYSMPREKNLRILICRGTRRSLLDIWPGTKHFD